MRNSALLAGVALSVVAVAPVDGQTARGPATFVPTVPFADGSRLRVEPAQATGMGAPATPPTAGPGLAPRAMLPAELPSLASQLRPGFALGTGKVVELGTAEAALLNARAPGIVPKKIALFPVTFQNVPLAKGSDVLGILGGDGRLLAARQRGIPVQVDAAQARTAATGATAAAEADFRRTTQRSDERAGDAELQVWVDGEQHGHLAWHLVVAATTLSQPAAIEYYVSAIDGRILGRENAIYTGVAGKVTGDVWATDPTAATTSEPLPFMTVTATGQGTTRSDAAGGFGFGGPSPTTLSSNLQGSFGAVANQAGTTSSATVVNASGSNVDLHFTATTAPAIAQPSAYFWINTARQFAISILNPAEPRLANLPINVNIAQTCNAFWFPDSTHPTVNFFSAGGGCQNSAYSDVALHEFGHGVDQMNGGILDGGYSEGFGDALSMLATQQSCVGRNFFGAGTCLRNATTVVNWPLPPGSDVHRIGQPYGGFVWTLVQRLRSHMSNADAFLTAKHLVLGAAAANPSSVPDAVMLSFMVDDDDGNLGTCSTNFADLAAAADARSIPRPPNCSPEIFKAVYAVGDNGSAPPNGIGGYDLLSGADQVLAIDFNGDGKQDLFLYRPGKGAAFVLKSNGDGTFTPVYSQGDPGKGIAGFDLKSPNDRAIVFDYNGDGKQDLFFYRPGSGAAWVARSNGDGTFTAVYAQGDPGKGIAGFDLKSPNDRVLAFDYNGDGKQDLFFYRPGTGAAWVARSNGDGTFTAVYAQGDPGKGIAGFDLKSPNDRVLAFDYDGDGKQDLFFYRPGTGAAWVARSNGDGTFNAVYAQGDPGNGIAGYDLKSPNDRVLAFDYNGDGKQDLFLYRPGKGAAWVARSNGNGTFTAVYAQGDPGTGIAGYDLKSPDDRVLAFDYNGDGKQDLFLYRPGRGAAWVARSNGNGTFTATFAVGDNGSSPPNGVAGYDLLSTSDIVVPFDFNGDHKTDLFLARPGRGAAWVAESIAN